MIRRWLNFVAAIAVVAAMMASNRAHAAVPSLAVADNALGVGFTSLPAGWSLAPPGQYTPGTIALIVQKNGESDVRLSVQPLGIGDTTQEAAAAAREADTVVQAANSPTSVSRTAVTIAGAQGVKLEGMPGPANVQMVVAHAGALYNIVTFDSDAIQPDQAAALASLRFIPRMGAFPSATPPAPRGLGVTRLVPRSLPARSVNRLVPLSINSNVSMYVFWGQSINGYCGSSGGTLATGNYPTCGGYFYGQGDHTGQDSYAIDWALNAGNSIFPQTPTPQVTHAGWTQGSFYGYGIWVVLDNGWGVASYYAHLKDVTVSAGTKANWINNVGHSGCTGNCSGAHVHVAWVQNPTYDQYGQPYNGTPEPQSPLYTFSSCCSVYNSLYAGELVHGW